LDQQHVVPVGMADEAPFKNPDLSFDITTTPDKADVCIT
jgi:hypothetical protein